MNLKKDTIALVVILCFIAGTGFSSKAAPPQSGTTGKCGKDVSWTYLDNQWVYQPGLYIDGNGALYDYDAGKAPWYKYSEDIHEIVIGDGVTRIGKNAFYGMKGINRLILSDSVVQIDDTALGGCSKDLVFCTNTNYGKEYAEKHNYKVVEGYAVPSEGKVITKGSNVSMDCLNYTVTTRTEGKNEVSVIGMNSKKRNVVIPASVDINGVDYKVTAIADKAFKGNYTITKIVIGKNVKSIGRQAFYNCKELRNVIIKTKLLSARRVKSKAFKKMNATAKVKVPKKKYESYKKFIYQRGLNNKSKVIY